MQMDRLTIKSQEALQEAQRIAQGFSHQEVDGEHLMLALIGQADSLIPDLLEKIGVPAAKLKPSFVTIVLSPGRIAACWKCNCRAAEVSTGSAFPGSAAHP